jgi:hypothetical protein
MPNKGYKIDPKLGLHELANSRMGGDLFNFQLSRAEEQTEYILSNLDNLVKNTITKAPKRTKDFCLGRSRTEPPLTHEEDKWERAMYGKWGPGGSGEFVSVCKRIQAYQYPLQATRKNRRWGKIDLLGIGTDFLPVPIELKRRKTNESPLKMLVEVAAYGFAIQKVWPNLREHWAEALCWFEGSPARFREKLDKVTLICVAPDEYWTSCLGQPGTNPGAFPPEAWPPFWELVDAFGKWFDIHFVAINEGSWDVTKESPKITGARLLDLRSRSARNS